MLSNDFDGWAVIAGGAVPGWACGGDFIWGFFRRVDDYYSRFGRTFIVREVGENGIRNNGKNPSHQARAHSFFIHIFFSHAKHS